MNSFLLVEGKSALLIETGFTAHEGSLVAQLEDVLDSGTELSILSLSPGEFRSVCNTRTIVDQFNVVRLIGVHDNVRLWSDFRADLVPPGEPVGSGRLGRVPVEVVRSAETTVHVDAEGRRPLITFFPLLRLLPTYWVYDEITRVLLTSDAFTHAWCDAPEGPWVDATGADTTSLEQLCAHLVETRYWWLPGAATEPIVEELRAILDRFDVEVIGPSYGRVFQGRSVVRGQFALLTAALDHLRLSGSSPENGLTRLRA